MIPLSKATPAKSPNSLGPPLRIALDGPLATWTLGEKELPPSALPAAKTIASVSTCPSVSPAPLPLSSRQSYQETAILPVVWSTARSGQNWLLAPVSSLTRRRWLQVEPLLSEKLTNVSVSALPTAGESVKTR